MEWALDEMAAKIAKIHPSANDLVVLGMASRGIPLAKKLCTRLSDKFGKNVPCGSIDASFYRDDFHYRKKVGSTEMRITEMPASVEGKVVILVDDVLYTGRSVRAAMQAVLDLGRPSYIRLCVLVDRGHRELPIQPDCAGLSVETAQNQEVRVMIEPIDNENSVYLVEVEDQP
ncbi:MAG: bifunctional pyr operon transcriptional regulator/uracil phosphoribosyltransferase PyrR [Fibrobacteraceae bacterium]|nr:bifunctional pyr operon transcriptional regulator/uracil phosphoribosyltransferase PyrR [Fibrobacteraceae bacterium]